MTTNDKREQARVLEPIAAAIKLHGCDYSEDDWNEDAHVEITITVKEARAVLAALLREAEAATAPDVSEAELAEWEALCDKATGGELRGMSEQGRSGLLWTLFTEYTLRVGSFTCREDALFFQQARTALPRLIAALRAARKREGELTQALADATADWDHMTEIASQRLAHETRMRIERDTLRAENATLRAELAEAKADLEKLFAYDGTYCAAVLSGEVDDED